jgi:hypothetical protein
VLTVNPDIVYGIITLIIGVNECNRLWVLKNPVGAVTICVLVKVQAVLPSSFKRWLAAVLLAG